MARNPRKPLNLSESLHRQLNSYALAASAAAVGVLALKPPAAEAKIIYTPTHQVIVHGLPYFLYLGKAKPDFKLGVGTCSPSSTNCARGGTSSDLYINAPFLGSTGSIAVGPRCRTWNSAGCALALKKGTKIPRRYAKPVDVMVGRIIGGRSYEFYWLPGTKNRYLGLTFYVNAERHYGWARVSVMPPRHPPQIVAVLTGYAYETIPNKPIIAGKTKGPDVMTLEPASLGHLARGASAMKLKSRTKFQQEMIPLPNN